MSLMGHWLVLLPEAVPAPLSPDSSLLLVLKEMTRLCYMTHLADILSCFQNGTYAQRLKISLLVCQPLLAAPKEDFPSVQKNITFTDVTIMN